MSLERVSKGASPGLQLFVCSFSPFFGAILRAGMIWFVSDEVPALWPVRAELGPCLHTQCHCQLWLQLIFLEMRFTSCKFYQNKLLDNFFFLKKKNPPSMSCFSENSKIFVLAVVRWLPERAVL